MKRALVVIFALAAFGCARNSIFELELDLPPLSPGDMRFTLVEANERGFGEDWPDTEPASLGPLVAGCARPDPAPPCGDRLELDPQCSAVVSVTAGGGRPGPLHVRVRFCQSPRCTLAEDERAPEAQVTIERAFYEARFTQARVCVDEVPASPITVPVDRCEVRCREGTAVQHCRADGSHFCE